MTSEHSEPQSPSSQPLLQDYSTSNPLKQKRDQSAVSLRPLEDGESSESGSEFEDLRRKGRPGFWRRLRMSMRRRRNGDGEYKVVRNIREEEKRRTQKWRWGWSRKRTCLGVPVVVMMFFGFIHILNFLCGYIPLFFSPFPSALDFKDPATASSEIASHLLDITRDVNPVPCHSHNDYWRRVPLYDALRWGCTGIEADVWLFDEELFVGHSTYALTANETFRSMYVDPLVKMLDYRNAENDFSAVSNEEEKGKQGVFQTSPAQTLVLLVDFKNNGPAIFPYVSSQLSALRDKGYLTYFDGTNTIEGAITVVATGNAPFDMIIANETYRDIFFDAPLAQLYEPDPSASSQSSATSKVVARGGQGTVGTSPTSHFDSTNSYYASVQMSKALGFVWWGGLSDSQLELLRGQVRGAHARGLKARYWSAPKWPIGLRNRVWETLVREGVDYLNGDDLRSMVGMLWGVKGHWGSLVG